LIAIIGTGLDRLDTAFRRRAAWWADAGAPPAGHPGRPPGAQGARRRGNLALGDRPAAANAGDKLLTLVMSALAGGGLHRRREMPARRGGTGRVLRLQRSRPRRPSARSCEASAGVTSASSTGFVPGAPREGLGRRRGPRLGSVHDRPRLDDSARPYGLQKDGARHHGIYPRPAATTRSSRWAAGTGDRPHGEAPGRQRELGPQRRANFLAEGRFGRVRPRRGERPAHDASGTRASMPTAVVAVCRRLKVRFSIHGPPSMARFRRG